VQVLRDSQVRCVGLTPEEIPYPGGEVLMVGVTTEVKCFWSPEMVFK